MKFKCLKCGRQENIRFKLLVTPETIKSMDLHYVCPQCRSELGVSVEFVEGRAKKTKVEYEGADYIG